MKTEESRALVTQEWIDMALGWWLGFPSNLPVAEELRRLPFAPEREGWPTARAEPPGTAALAAPIVVKQEEPVVPAEPEPAVAPRVARRSCPLLFKSGRSGGHSP